MNYDVNSLVLWLINILIILPIATLIHEFGHGFFAKIFGSTISHIDIGSGKILFKIHKLNIRKYYFFFGYIELESVVKKDRVLAESLFLLGGIIFNVLSILFVYTISCIWHLNSYFLGNFNYTSSLLAIFAAIPITYPNGMESDGKQFFNLLFSKKDAK